MAAAHFQRDVFDLGTPTLAIKLSSQAEHTTKPSCRQLARADQADAIRRVTTQRCLAIWRCRAKPRRSNIATVAL